MSRSKKNAGILHFAQNDSFTQNDSFAQNHNFDQNDNFDAPIAIVWTLYSKTVLSVIRVNPWSEFVCFIVLADIKTVPVALRADRIVRR